MLNQYLSEFKERNEVVTGAGGKPGKHPASVDMVYLEQGLEVDILSTEESIYKREEFKKGAAQRYLVALFFDGLSNAKFNALKTDISTQ